MNMDLAPVLDTASGTDTIDDEDFRSFSEVGATAGAYGLAFLRGLTDGGMIGVVKHFPGLGHANGDTDTGPATDPPLSALEGDDLIPFEQAIAAHAPVVMMSNVTEPDWGEEPASLNPAAYAFLRHLGFTGMILTDSLDAGAISDDRGRRSAGSREGYRGRGRHVDGDHADGLPGSSCRPGTGGVIGAAASQPGHQDSVDRIIAVKNLILPAADRITPPD